MFDKDAATIRDVHDGRTEAFATLVDRHKDRVFAVLMRLTADPAVADELAQETFVRAYSGLAGFRGGALFSTWLTQIAVHLARDHIRQRQRNRLVSLDALLESHADSSVLAEGRSHYDPLTSISERELAERFESALKDLPPNYREVFVLYHLQDMSYEEIAGVTGDSIGSLKVRVHRARKLMKESLFPKERSEAAQDLGD